MYIVTYDVIMMGDYAVKVCDVNYRWDYTNSIHIAGAYLGAEWQLPPENITSKGYTLLNMVTHLCL